MTDTDNPMLASLNPFFVQCEKNIQQYNLVASQLAAAEGDRDAAITAWMDGSDDGEAVAIREAIKRASDKLRSLAEVAVGDEQVSDADKAKLRTLKETSEKKLKAASRALRNLAEPFDIDVTPYLQKMGDPFLPKQATGMGTGLPRPSVYVETTRNGDPLRRMTFENLSNAAKHVDLTAEDLGKLYAQAAGVAYEDIASVKTITEFTWHNTNLKDAPVWTIKTTPKESKRGREVVAKPADSQELPASNDEEAA